MGRAGLGRSRFFAAFGPRGSLGQLLGLHLSPVSMSEADYDSQLSDWGGSEPQALFHPPRLRQDWVCARAVAEPFSICFRRP